jgi:hypothetical protein
MCAGFTVFAPYVNALQRTGKQDAITLEELVQERPVMWIVRTQFARRPLPVAFEASLMDIFGNDLPVIRSPDHIAKPEDAEVVVIKSADGVWTSNFCERVSD